MNKKYLASYYYNNAQWSFEFFADDMNDAKKRLESIKEFGKFDGEIKLKIPTSKNGFINNVIKKILNLMIGTKEILKAG